MKIEQVIKSTRDIHDQYLKTFLNVVYSGIWLQEHTIKPLKSQDLTHPQYNVLRIVKGYKGKISVASIQQRMLYKTSNVTRIIDRLVEKMFLVKETSQEDRRVVFVNITELGNEVLHQLTDELNILIQQVVGDTLSLDETKMLSVLLEKMRT